MVDKVLPVNITQKALKKVNQIIINKNISPDYGLRIGIKGNGCIGNSFLLGFDKKKTSDEEFELEGLKIYIKKKHIMYLIGLEIDFYDKTDTKGFTFIDPRIENNSN